MDMSKLYEANMKALSERYPDLVKKVNETKLDEEFRVRGTGSENKVNVFSETLNSFCYDEQDPIKGVEIEYDSLNLKNAKIAIFLGFGLGIELQLYVTKYSSKLKTREIVIVEKSLELFKIALHMFDYTLLFKDANVLLIVGKEAEAIFPLMVDYFRGGKRIFLIKAMKPLYLNSFLTLYKEYYLSCLRKINEAATFTLSFFGNSPDDSLVGVENMLDNINEIIKNPGINLLFNKFEGKPAVIVSTGPSLNKNKHLLKGLNDKSLIIAADASLNVLMKMGVKPHLVTSLERFPETAKLVEGYDEKDVDNVYFAACPVLHKSCYEVYPGPRIIVYRNFDHFRWLGVERGLLDIKQSAGNMAFKIATALGCNPIILIGQDLAYARDGRSHAEGNFYGERQEIHYSAEIKESIVEVMGNDGEPVLTHKYWDQFRRGYELDIAEYSGLCINSTEGGAFIQGTEIMTFSDAIEKYIRDDFNPLKIIEDSIKAFTLEDELKDYKNIKEKVVSTMNDLKTISDMCHKAYDEVFNHTGEYRRLITTRDMDLLEKLEEQIAKDLKMVSSTKDSIFKYYETMQLFMMHIIQPYYVNMEIGLHGLPDVYDNSTLIDVNVIMEYIKFFAVINNIIKLCLESLNNAVYSLENITL